MLSHLPVTATCQFLKDLASMPRCISAVCACTAWYGQMDPLNDARFDVIIPVHLMGLHGEVMDGARGGGQGAIARGIVGAGGVDEAVIVSRPAQPFRHYYCFKNVLSSWFKVFLDE